MQQGLMAQLERYEQTEEREGAEAAEKQREMDYAEAVANLEVAIFSARNHMRKADARADREARFERAQPRIETVAAARHPLPTAPQGGAAECQGARRRRRRRRRQRGRRGGWVPPGVPCAPRLTARRGCPDAAGGRSRPRSALAGPGQPGGRPKEERILAEATGETYSPAEYERLAGMGQGEEVAQVDARAEPPTGSTGRLPGGARREEGRDGGRPSRWYLVAHGRELLSRQSRGLPTTGEHTVRYDDGDSEDLLLPMQRVKWLPAETGLAGAGAACGRPRPAQWKMRHSERRRCFEVLEVLRNEPDPDDDPDDEDEPRVYSSSRSRSSRGRASSRTTTS